GADVASGAIEVNVQRGRHCQLPKKAGHARKIRIRYAGAVVTLWMRRVIAQNGQRFFAVPEAHQGNHGINGSLGLGSQGRIGAGRVADGTHFSIRPEDAAVRGNLLDTSFTEAEVRDGPRMSERGPDSSFEFNQRLPLEAALELPRLRSRFFEDLFGGEIAVGSVMLVQAGKRNS